MHDGLTKTRPMVGQKWKANQRGSQREADVPMVVHDVSIWTDGEGRRNLGDGPQRSRQAPQRRTPSAAPQPYVRCFSGGGCWRNPRHHHPMSWTTRKGRGILPKLV